MTRAQLDLLINLSLVVREIATPDQRRTLDRYITALEADRYVDEAGLSESEKAAQAKRCPCRGADDYCPCQNAPDRVTANERANLDSVTKP